MSNVLAIAAVTQLLKDLINDTLINGNVSQALGADFTVTALPPDRIVADNGEQATQLNLFLYSVSPNGALRNEDLPTRNGPGQIVRRPRLALDLHYILTAVSGEELHAEILLGYAMQLLHESAILGRETIRQALDLATIDDVLPQQLDPIRASELADQIELLKITPRTLSTDDMSKLWTAFQASYRTTVAYDVSLVLIERELPERSPLPVLSRGGLTDPATGRDPGPTVRPNLLNTVPTVTSMQSGDGQPVMRLGGTVVVTGYSLDGGPGAQVTVRFTESGTGVVLALAPQGPAAPNRLVVRLPETAAVTSGSPAEGTVNDPASWRIGSYFVDVEVSRADGRETISNALPLALAPASTPSAVAAPPNVEITMTCAPPIRPGQRLAILAGQEMRVLASPALAADEATATFSGLASGTQVPVRLRVDGIDSPVIDLSTTPPSLTTVTIP
jgi:Pvc16 N-terminal domain